MAKLFVQSQCPTCGAATLMTDFRSINDLGTIESLTTPVEHHSDVVVNLDEIKTRLQQSLNYDQATSYKKQKHSLFRRNLGFSWRFAVFCYPCDSDS